MHNILEKQDSSIKIQYLLVSPWIQLISEKYCAFLQRGSYSSASQEEDRGGVDEYLRFGRRQEIDEFV
jgi:hypothetical protein